MNDPIALWIVGGVVLLVLAIAVTHWVQAELDERRWRRKLREEQLAVLIRERRYGPKGGKR